MAHLFDEPGPWVWGVDVSINHVAFMALREGEKFPFQLDMAHAKGAQRPQKLHALSVALPPFVQMHAALRPPLAVWVELPGGRPNPSLVGAYGVILASIWGALAPLNEWPTAVYSISSSDWKKKAIGKGNASKEIILDWARSAGFEHDSADVIDAYGVATAAMIELGREP